MTKTAVSFDDFDNAQALREGWGLFDAHGVLEIQRIDEPDLPDALAETLPRFPTDGHAVLHVMATAAAGSAYHQQAWSLNGMYSSSHLDLGPDKNFKSHTNEQFVVELMTSSRYGALGQMFVLDAILQHATRVAAADPKAINHPLVLGAAWVAVAKEIEARCAAKYGEAEPGRPAS